MTLLSPSDLAALAVALIGVVASVGALYWQVRKEWLLHSATTITDLLEQFRSDEFAAQRRQCALQAEAHLRGGPATLVRNYGHGVPRFFENIGIMVRRGALHEEMVWCMFGQEILGYWTALASGRNLINEVRTHDNLPFLYEEFEWLQGRMRRRCMHRGRPVDTDPARVEWMGGFLEQERTSSEPAARGERGSENSTAMSTPLVGSGGAGSASKAPSKSRRAPQQKGQGAR